MALTIQDEHCNPYNYRELNNFGPQPTWKIKTILTISVHIEHDTDDAIFQEPLNYGSIKDGITKYDVGKVQTEMS